MIQDLYWSALTNSQQYSLGIMPAVKSAIHPALCSTRWYLNQLEIQSPLGGYRKATR